MKILSYGLKSYEGAKIITEIKHFPISSSQFAKSKIHSVLLFHCMALKSYFSVITMDPVTFSQQNTLEREERLAQRTLKKIPAKSINQSCATVVTLTNVCRSHFLCGSGAFVKGKQ